jgi:ADP-heptose:LPS heptosyltransferase
MKKILLVNFGGIGDEILFLPTIESIKKTYPDSHITLLLEPRASSIQYCTNLIDRTIVFDIKKKPLLLSDLLTLAALLRDGNYDAVVSSGSSPLVSCLLWLSGIGCRIGYDTGELSRLLLTKAVPLNRQQHAISMYHDLVQGLRINTKPELPELLVNQENRQFMASFLEKQGISSAPGNGIVKVIVHPGASQLALEKGIVKTWPALNWAQLIATLAAIKNLVVILAGGPDDQATISDIANLTRNLPYVTAYGHTKGLTDLVALIDLCDLLVCIDSAPMHIGVGLDKPLVALFGPTEPFHLLPQDSRFKVLRGINLDQPFAGVQLEPETVLEAVIAQLPIS